MSPASRERTEDAPSNCTAPALNDSATLTARTAELLAGLGSIGTRSAPAAVANATTSVICEVVVLRTTGTDCPTGNEPTVHSKSTRPDCVAIVQVAPLSTPTARPVPTKLPISSIFSPGTGPTGLSVVKVHRNSSLGIAVAGDTEIDRPRLARPSCEIVSVNTSVTNSPSGSSAVTVTLYTGSSGSLSSKSGVPLNTPVFGFSEIFLCAGRGGTKTAEYRRSSPSASEKFVEMSRLNAESSTAFCGPIGVTSVGRSLTDMT